MLKTIAAGMAIGLIVAGGALAQTVRHPAMPEPLGSVLVKHDGDHGEHGRKLGHYKHRGGDQDRDRRAARRGYYPSSPWGYYPPAPYYGTPGYGSSYPPPYGDFYDRPFYGGY